MAHLETRAPRSAGSSRGRVVSAPDPCCFSEAGSHCVTAEADSEIIRGRPPVFSDDDECAALKTSPTACSRSLCSSPIAAETLDWLLRPIGRHALLTELGRIALPESDANGALRWNEDDVSRLVQAALELAEARLPTKAGVSR